VQLLGQHGVCEFVGLDGGKPNWILEEDVLTVSLREDMAEPNHVISKLLFRDADIHVEFQLPEGWTGNSGLYLHGLYELQILNSFGVTKMTNTEMGALYRFYEPLVNASRPAMEWQAYDLRYFAPRRDAHGKATKPGVVSAWLNGKLVQDRAQFSEPRSNYCPLESGTTPHLNALREQLKITEQGPLFLQEHLSPVCFRNIWIKSLDGRINAGEFNSQPKLIIGLIGDSTAATTYGWGPALADQLIDNARVINYAENGATLQSLSKELDALLEWSPDYVLVQFGHNDQKRYDVEAYGDLLKSYVSRIRAAGAKAVIVSPVTRRSFDESGKIKPQPWGDPNQPYFGTLADYAQKSREVAQQLETPFIHLHSLTVEHHNKVGPEASKAYNYSLNDITHFSKTGADAVASLVLDELRKTVPELVRPQLR
jgi:lysophospholipase L1-like esterase